MAMRTTLVILLMSFAATQTAQAQPADEGWRLSAGGGALLAPSYEGDDDYQLSVLPSVEIAYGSRFRASVENGARYALINEQTLRAGPIGRIRFAREEDGSRTFAVSGDDTDDLRGLGDVDTSIELGGYAEYDIGALTLSAEVRQAVSGHDGAVAEMAARWSGRGELFDAPIVWSVGPRARIVDDRFNRAYFGVDAAQSVASGLPVFSPSGGLHSYGIGASVIMPVGSDWAAVLVVGYDRLAGEPADSPLVRERGSPDQSAVGVFFTRRL